VTAILRCVELKKHTPNAIPTFDLNKEMQSKNSGGQDTNPFQIEQGVWLGGGDFQLRSVVVGPKAATEGHDTVRLATWGSGKDRPLGDVARALGRVGLAQAEYFFDLRVFDDYADQTRAQDREEWLWHQGWVARMRSFRLRQGGTMASGSNSAAQDGSLDAYTGGESLQPKRLSDCKECGGLSGFLTKYGVGE
jgi:hypothetical protein